MSQKLPIARRRAIYGENPEQSQYASSGSLPLTPKEFESGLLPGNGPFGFVVPTSKSPALGYNWEIVSLHIPTSVVVTGAASGVLIELTLNVNVGSRNLFSIVQTANPNMHTQLVSKGAVQNFLFSEAPPQPVLVPSGQELVLELSLSLVPVSNPVNSTSIFMARKVTYSPGTFEGKETFAYIVGGPLDASINYRFV